MKKEHWMTCAVLLILWQLCASAVGNDILIPSVAETARYLFGLFGTAKFYSALWASIFRIMCGWSLSLAAALILSILCSLYPRFKLFFEPVAVLMRTIPNVSYIIIALIWLGSEGAVMLVSFLILFPIFMNGFMNRMDQVSRECRDVESVYPETVKFRIVKVILPMLAKEIISTGKTAASMGFKVGVMAEILGSVPDGIGRSINYCRMDLNTAGILAWTVVLIVIAGLLDTLFGKIEKKVKEEQGWKD